jgi:hypothetical protein
MRFASLFSLLLFVTSNHSIAQIDFAKAISSNNGVPSNWNSNVINGKQWILTRYLTVQESKIESADARATQIKYQFLANEILMLPFKIDTFKLLPATYFPNERTFYVSANQCRPNAVSYLETFPYKINYLDSTYLILEEIDLGHFDLSTGKVLTDQEFKAKQDDVRKKRLSKPVDSVTIGPGFFSGTPIRLLMVFKKE